MRVVTFTQLYPNARMPAFCLFVEHRLRRLVLEYPEIQPTVVAPVPWFPSSSPHFGRYAEWASVPGAEQRHGIDVLHPRYPLIPKIGMSLAALLLATACRPVLKKLMSASGRIDLLDAHYMYPDGVAAVLLGRWLELPVVITARGSDINEIASYSVPRRQMLWAARHCEGIVTVSDALKKRVVSMGVPDSRVRTLYNGVDFELFCPSDRAECRAALGLDAEACVVLSVGNLVDLKGHDVLIDAMQFLDDKTCLLIVGDGPARSRLEKQADALGIGDRVRFCGTVEQDSLPMYYSAADVSALASLNEGLANVWLESLACGTPVVTSHVGGAAEVVSNDVAGCLVADNSPRSFAGAIRATIARESSAEAVRQVVRRFDWSSTVSGLYEIFRNATDRRQRAHPEPTQ